MNSSLAMLFIDREGLKTKSRFWDSTAELNAASAVFLDLDAGLAGSEALPGSASLPPWDWSSDRSGGLVGPVRSEVTASGDGEDEGRFGSGASVDGGDTDAAVPVLRILLVEDDAIDARLIRLCAAAIERMRLVCEVAPSVAAARALLATRPFDLCITDFWLGFESSLGFVASLNGLGAPVPVIVLTSLSTPEIRRLCLRAGAASVMGKENLSPERLEEAVAAAVRDRSRSAAAGAEPGAQARTGQGFLDSFERIVGPADDPAPSGSGGGAADRESRALETSIQAFASASETARLALLEQIVAVRDAAVRSAEGQPATRATDLVEAVATACSLVEARGRPIAFKRDAGPVRSNCHEPALIFIAYELMSRVSEIAADRSTIAVDLQRVNGICTLNVSGPTYGSLPALPVTFTSLFTSILRRCHGVVEVARSPGRSITLTARFPDDLDPSKSDRPH